MLARKLKIRLNGLEVGETPILVPSFSSRANIDVRKMIDSMSETINEAILISGYDVFHSKDFPSITFPDLIFLDSGGYECNIDNNISETGYYKPETLTWSIEKYMDVIKSWPNQVPTVIISYDHPSRREIIEKQILNAQKLFDDADYMLKEFLIKPESHNTNKINLKSLIKNIDLLASFDLLGVTEKELGNSIFDRMIMIAKIRGELDRNEIDIPLHVFGSLDTITTPLYYFAGADVFDGLSWLRFTYHEGDTFYTNSFGPKLHGVHKNTNSIQTRNFDDNITYLLRLKLKLKKFQSSGDFEHFGKNSDFFSEAYDDLRVEMKGMI